MDEELLRLARLLESQNEETILALIKGLFILCRLRGLKPRKEFPCYSNFTGQACDLRFCDRGGDRTHDLGLMSPSLYH